MLALILTLAAISADDVLLPLGSWEGRVADPATAWQRPKEARDDGVAQDWSELRTTITLAEEPQEGTWLLVCGPAGIPVQASMGDQDLELLADPQADQEAATGAAFRVPHRLLQAGDQLLTLRLPAGGALRCVLEGPAYLLSPRLARYYRERLQAPTRGNAANLSTRSQSSHQGHVADRVQFRDPMTGRFRTAAFVDIRLVDGERERDLVSLAAVQTSDSFPLGELQAVDPDFPGMDMFVRCLAPLSPERPAESVRPLLIGEIANRATREPFQQVYHLRLFPCRGGALKARERDGVVLLGNDEVGLFVTHATVLGPPDQPTGLAITLQQSVGGSGKPTALMGPREIWGLTAPDAADRERPRQYLRALQELADDYSGLLAKTANWANDILFLSRDQWSAEDVFPMTASRSLGRHVVQSLRDDASVQRFQERPRELYWTSLLPTLHLPAQERRFLDLLTAASVEDPATAVYACLRATRFLHWQEDEALAAEWLPTLQAWWQQTRALDAAAPTSLLVARLAAGSAVAQLLRQLASEAEADALEALLERDQRMLLAPVEEGGRWQEDHLVPGPDEDPLRLAECLALPILPEEIREAQARHLELQEIGPADLGNLEHLLHTLALLRAGRTGLAVPLLQELVGELETSAQPPPTSGALYAVLIHGVLGVRKPSLGEVEVRAMMDPGALLRLSLPLGSGVLSLHMERPDRSLFRKVTVTNATGHDLRLIYAVPGHLGPGLRVLQGDLRYSLYECSVSSGERHNDEVR